MKRRSKQKECILRILKNTTSHPTADWIHAEVRKEIPNISLATVYRNIRQLSEENVIMRLDISSTFCRYDGNPQNHYHFRCECCQRIFDVNMPVLSDLDDKATQLTGFEVSHHILEFRGICRQCKAKQNRCQRKSATFQRNTFHAEA